METPRPKVSIGLPVYNAQRYLKESLDSLLGQAFGDFEILLCDNASTDATESICRDYAARDARIRYRRNAENIGAVPNHNLTVEMSRGDYFMFSAYDDIRHGDYLERCVAELESHPGTVLCHTRTRYIDETGQELPMRETELEVGNPRPSRRFAEFIRMDHKVEAVLGLIRLATLRRTGLLGVFADSDRVLGAELALHGPFRILPESAFSRRYHAAQSARQYASRQERAAWFDPRRLGRLSFPHFRQGSAYAACVLRAPLAFRERAACLAILGAWAVTNRKRLYSDLAFGMEYAARSLLSRLRPRPASSADPSRPAAPSGGKP